MDDKLINDILQWDVKSWSPALLYWEKKAKVNTLQNALELGGREGGLSLWLALKGCSVVCSDLREVQKTSEKLHLSYPLGSRISYEDIDACNIPYENHFDLIVFKSIVGGIGHNNGIERQRRVFREVHKALKPGGKLLFAENLAASPLHQWLRKKFVAWGSSWRYVSLEEMKDFLSPFSKYELKTSGVSATFGRTEKQRSFLSAVDLSVLNKICPARWKYIGYGIAEK